MNILISIFFLCVLLSFSAFFSSSETAIFSLSSLEIANLSEKNDKKSQTLKKLVQNPRMLLVTILFGNTLVNISFFSISNSISLDVAKIYGASFHVLGGILALLTVIMFGEVLPKAIAIKKSLFLARLFCIPLHFILCCLSPITSFLDKIIYFLSKIFSLDKEKISITSDEMKDFLALSEQKGILPATEHEMLLDLMDLKNIKVKEIMIPRVHLVKASIGWPKERIESLFISKKTKKIAIYHNDDEDDIIGILHAKDFFLSKDKNIKKIISPVPFISENFNVESLLSFMDKNQKKEVFIMDEYGGLEGFISLDGLMEELIEEMDENDVPLIKNMGNNIYHISGKLPLKEWQLFFNIETTSSHCTTLSGWMIFLLQRLPKKGDTIQYKNCKMKVLEVKKYQIMSIALEILPDSEI